MRIHGIRHVAFEGLGTIEEWALSRGHGLTVTDLFAGEELPGTDGFDWLVVMGGPMNIYEEEAYPWLAGEKKLIRAAVDAGKRVLGICLGAQLLADALGAPVVRGEHKEIGWYPIEATPEGEAFGFLAAGAEERAGVQVEAAAEMPEESGGIPAERGLAVPAKRTVFHWHGDTFALPVGAKLLASSEGCRHQAFLYGSRAMGLQFHLELREEDIRRMLKHGVDELTAGGRYVQSEAAIWSEAPRHLEACKAAMAALLDGLERT